MTITNTPSPLPDNAGDDIDPALIALLSKLWLADTGTPAKPWSLAKLSKQSELHMSTLLRHLNTLSGAGLATLSLRDEGGGSASLTPAGRELCQAIFGLAANDASPP